MSLRMEDQSYIATHSEWIYYLFNFNDDLGIKGVVIHHWKWRTQDPLYEEDY